MSHEMEIFLFNNHYPRSKTISSFPDEDSAMKIFYLKAIEFNSKHIFRKMNGYYKCQIVCIILCIYKGYLLLNISLISSWHL